MRTGKSRRVVWGFVPLELMAVIAVIAVLLGLGVIVVRSARQQAHRVQAEGRLKQVAVGLDLYYRKFGKYPATGSNLAEELGEFIKDGTVFTNPLKDEEAPGETISEMYQEPTTQEIDSPENYVTAMVGEDGKTIVILKTLGKVDTTTDGNFDPDDPVSSKFAAETIVELEKQADPEPETPPADPETPPTEPETPPTEPETPPATTPTDGEDLGDGVVVTYDIEYETKKKTGAVIKFEAKGDQLGDDKGKEKDSFTLEVKFDNPEAVDDVVVNIKVKASTETFVTPDGIDTIGELDNPTELINEDWDGEGEPPSSGWWVDVDLDDNSVEITFDVEADGNQPHALSNVEFQFPNGDVEIIRVKPIRRYDTDVDLTM